MVVYSVHGPFSLISKNLKNKLYIIRILPAVQRDYEICSLELRQEHRLKGIWEHDR